MKSKRKAARSLTRLKGTDLLIFLLQTLANQLSRGAINERRDNILHQRRGGILRGPNVVALENHPRRSQLSSSNLEWHSYQAVLLLKGLFTKRAGGLLNGAIVFLVGGRDGGHDLVKHGHAH